MSDLEMFRALIQQLIDEVEAGGVDIQSGTDCPVYDSALALSAPINKAGLSIGFGEVLNCDLGKGREWKRPNGTIKMCYDYARLQINSPFEGGQQLDLHTWGLGIKSDASTLDLLAYLRRWLLIEPENDATKPADPKMLLKGLLTDAIQRGDWTLTLDYLVEQTNVARSTIADTELWKTYARLKQTPDPGRQELHKVRATRSEPAKDPDE